MLPAGKWYDFYTGKLAGESETIEVTPALGEIPLFVKDGEPGPDDRRPPVGARRATRCSPLEVRHYGEQPGKLALYDDDGETFDYERGDARWTQLSGRAGRPRAGRGRSRRTRTASAGATRT